MALKGDTSNLQLADIFQTLATSGQTGLLTLVSGKTERRILFSRFGVTPADASVFRAPRLGHLLVAGGLVPQEQIEAAIQDIDRDGPNPFSSVPLLVILEERGLLPLQQGVQVLRTEAREELFEVFRLAAMEFEFLDDDVPVEGIPKNCYFRVEEVVLEAARRLDEWERMAGKVDPAEYYVLTSAPPQQYPVLRMLDGRNTVVDIAERLMTARFDVLRTVWGLVEEGRARPATPDELIAAARSLDVNAHRLKVTRLCQRVLLRLGETDARLDDVGDLLIRAGATQPAVDVLARRARVLLKQGHPETAYAQVVRARDLDPNHLGMLEVLAELHRVRGEDASEVKVLTSLAERSAAEGRFDRAAEYAARVAELAPDSPLLDHTFVLYCQKAERHEFGAEVLSNAASKRSDPTRAAILYNGILLLDPSRADIKKAVARQQRARRKARTVWLLLGALAVPVLGVGVHLALSRVDQARLLGRVDAAEELLRDGEVRLAKTRLTAIIAEGPDSELRRRIDSLLELAEVRLQEMERTEKEARDRDLQVILAEIQDLIGAGDYAAALRAIEARTGEAEGATLEKLLARPAFLLTCVQDESSAIQRQALTFSMPKGDLDLELVLERFGETFSHERIAAFEKLRAVLSEVRGRPLWQPIHGPMLEAADGALAALRRVRPALDEVAARIARNEELDLLSEDYEAILAAEERGDFRAAVDGYERLLREYNEGPLLSFLKQRLAAARRVVGVQQEVNGLLERGNVAAAATAMRDAVQAVQEHDLGRVIGIPTRVAALPRGAELLVEGKRLGVAPRDVFVRTHAPLKLTARAPGFETTDLTLDAAALEPTVTIELRRDGRFETPLKARVDATPAVAAGQAFVAGRDGVLYRVELRDGSVSGTCPTGSLSGTIAPPIIRDDLVLVVLGEGSVAGIDRVTLTKRWVRPLNDATVGVPACDGATLFVALRDGRVMTVAARDGKADVIGSVTESIVAGTVCAGSAVVVGTREGRVVGLSRAGGAPVFRTAAGSQPVAGLAADLRRVYAAFDSGRIVALDPADGKEIWRRECGEAFAAGPVVAEGAVLFGAGRTAFVLDAATGEIRRSVGVGEWIGGAPALSGGRLYVGDRAGRLSVFDFQNGDLLFKHRLPGALRAAPLVLPEGVLLTSDQGVIAFIGT